MSVSAIAKVFTGLAITGGVVATPFALFKESSIVKLENAEDKNKRYLEEGFGGCIELLERGMKKDHKQQIYLCPPRGNRKLEMIYFEEAGGQKSAKIIKELRQNYEASLKQKLIIKFEDLQEKTLDWPDLLFSYDDPGVSGKATLNPQEDCRINTQGEAELFSCNSTWKVIKRK